jgi:hypothetical protein
MGEISFSDVPEKYPNLSIEKHSGYMRRCWAKGVSFHTDEHEQPGVGAEESGKI